MNFDGRLLGDEPPDGDFVRYVESLVGGPPEDPERAARELADRLARRATRDHERAAATASTAPGFAENPAASDRAVPSAAEAWGRTPADRSTTTDRPVAALGPPPIADLAARFAPRLLVLAGAALIGASILTGAALFGPAIVLIVAGLVLGDRHRRRARRTATSR